MMRIPILVLMMAAAPLFVFSQPVVEWKKAYGGSSADWVGSTSQYSRSDIQQTSDGGYICIGSTVSFDGDITATKGGGDIWVVKTTATGAMEWQETYGGSAQDYGTCILQTADGGYMAAGYTTSGDSDVSGFKGTGDIWVFKLDALGTMEWNKCLGGTSWDEHTQSLKQTPDGGYVLTGLTRSTNGNVTGKHTGSAADIWVVKLTASGNVQWQKCLGGTGAEICGSVQPTKDGGYIVAGGTGSGDGDITKSWGGGDAWLVKLSPAGAIEWQKSFGGSKFEHFAMATEAIDGGYIAAGITYSDDNEITALHDSTEVWLVKTDDTGKIAWSKTYGGSKYDGAYSIVTTVEGYYIVSGTTCSNDGDVSGLNGFAPDHLLLGIETDGTLKWSKVIGSQHGETNASVATTNDSGFVMFGVLLDSSGDGAGCAHHFSSDYWIVKFGKPEDIGVRSLNAGKLNIYPNPANDMVTIELPYFNDKAQVNITGINGSVLKTVSVTSEKMRLDISGFSPGIYLLHYTDGEHRHVVKVAKM